MGDWIPQAQAAAQKLPFWRHQAAVLRAFDHTRAVVGHHYAALGAFVGVGGGPNRYWIEECQ